MPPKIRDLVGELEKAGFEDRGGKGSHRNFKHPLTGKKITISGKLGADAKAYQVKLIASAIKDVEQ